MYLCVGIIVTNVVSFCKMDFAKLVLFRY